MARQPGVHDSLRSSTTDEVACTATCWSPFSLEARAVAELPAAAGPPPGELTQAQPRARVLWKTAKEPIVPVKAQWGRATPGCIRPSSATAPASTVTASGSRP